jgi:ATP-dependent Clp protease ATP-binding subunit ClpA
MPVATIRGPWSRRGVLTWTATISVTVGALKLAVRQAADPSVVSPGTEPAVGGTPQAPSTPSLTRARPYSPRAGRVLREAQQEAYRRSQPAYDQENLLFGIAIVPEWAGLEILWRQGISQDRLRAEVEAVIASAAAQPMINVNQSTFQVRPAPRAQAALALAADEVRDLRHAYVGVEHLLLGILRQGSGPGYEVLTRLGVSLSAARVALREYLNGMVVMGYDRNGDAIGYSRPVASAGPRTQAALDKT